MPHDISSIYSHESKEDENYDIHINLFNNLLSNNDRNTRVAINEKIQKEWTQKAFDESILYYVDDTLLWGPFFICLRKITPSNKVHCLLLNKFGISSIEILDISSKSQYYPAIENLSGKDKNLNVKKYIAVALLQKFSELTKEQLQRLESIYSKLDTSDYDQVYAGELASRCKLVSSITSHLFGQRLLTGDLLQERSVKSTLLDVIYESNENTIELNNRLVFHLGEQLEQLFNPVTEYSPEQTEYGYKSPEDELPTETDSPLVKAICNELLEIQSNFTFNLVEFLQKFLITLRVQVLNNEIEGLSTVKLNRLFPPTIDEVTRINCIFLDSLKSATPYGSFEILKACNITIPYFYKAYTRHEAATKNFTKDIKLFLRNFKGIMPHSETYTEMKLETILKGPQEKILKLKLIIDRLYQKKVWSDVNKKNAKSYYDNIIDVINSFGHLDAPMSSYNTRVFTPSGKILTELAKGWPVELQYKWLKRRVVGVFDIIDINFPSKRNLLVIFSDYVVILNIIDFRKYYTKDNAIKPLISDILMNSLINELPLPAKIPKLEVVNYCYISDIHASVVNERALRFDSFKEMDENPFSITCELASKSNTISEVADIITKAKILEKDTAFHLFRASAKDIILYSTAHELESYNSERIKSKFALFLNIKSSEYLLNESHLHLAIFAKFENALESDIVKLEFIYGSNPKNVQSIKISANEMIPRILKELVVEFPICYSSIYSDMASSIIAVNESIVRSIRKGENTEVESYNDTPNFSNEGNEETRKSYGTITTFSSDVSDIKEIRGAKSKTESKKTVKSVTSGKKDKKLNEKVQKREKTIAARQKEQYNKKSAAKATIPKNSKMEEKQNKRKSRGFFGMMKNIFSNSGKHKKQISKPISKKQGQEETIKTVMKNSTAPVRKHTLPNLPPSKIETKSDVNKVLDAKIEKSVAEDAIVNSSEHEQVRISSVVRNPEYEVPDNDKPKKNVHIIAEKTNTESNDIIVIEESEEMEEIKTPEKNNQKLLPQIPITKDNDSFKDNINYNNEDEQVGNDTDIKLSHPIEHQSRLFEDDLFGDFVPLEMQQIQEKLDNEEPIVTESIDLHDSTKKIVKQCKVSNQDDSDSHLHSVEKNEEIENSLEIKKHTEDTDTIAQKKNPIFPNIEKIEPPVSHIHFNKSPSFVELFHGMRVVLDESDAKYNWRRLSTEASLNEKYLVNNENVDEGLEVINEQQNKNSQPSTPSKGYNGEANKLPSKNLHQKTESSPFRVLAQRQSPKINYNQNANNSDQKMLEKPVMMAVNTNYTNNNRNTNSSNNGSESRTLTGSPFKVINKSPIKFVSKTSATEHKDIENDILEHRRLTQLNRKELGTKDYLKLTKNTTNEFAINDSNIGSDFSFVSDINKETNKRWVKLTVPSKDDFLDETFQAPSEKPSDMFSENDIVNSDQVSNSTLRIPENQTTNDELKSTNSTDVNQDKKLNSHLLDDIEFSSFDMSFNTTSIVEEAEQSKILYSDDTRNDNSNILGGTQIPRMEAPVVYRFSKDMSFDGNKSEARATIMPKSVSTSKDEDPIWVSPSKIDFMTLSKATDKTPKKSTLVNEIYSKSPQEETIYDDSAEFDESNDSALSKDMSFAFLGNFVEIDETTKNNISGKSDDYYDDKPTRLQFK